jgi:hypothetical protein
VLTEDIIHIYIYTIYLKHTRKCNNEDTSSKVQFPRKSYIEFWVSTGGSSPSQQENFNILLPFGIFYLCETGFSAVAPMKAKDVENDLKEAISKHRPRYDKLCSK